jgi:polysaccharide export outer membrane protein
VIGAVARPQVINIPNEGLNLMEVIALCGDILPDGKKDEVFIIRDSASSKQVKKLNLEDNQVFATEWYYMRPNDVVYVVADTKRLENDERRRRIQTTLSLAVSGVSLLVIIIDRLLR